MHTPHSIIEHTHAKILVSAVESQVECQVRRGDDDDGIVDHSCNLAYASK